MKRQPARAPCWSSAVLAIWLAVLVPVGAAAQPTFTLGVTPTTQGVCAPADGVYTVNVGSVDRFSNPVTLSTTGHPAGTTVGFSTNPVPPPGSSTMTIGNTGVAAPGSYTIDVQGQSPDPITIHQTATLSVFSNPPGTPALLAPANGATNQLLSPNFTWSPATQAATYTLEIATDAAFTNIVHTGSGLTATSYNGATLGPNALYYWRVRTANSCGASSNSATFSFTTTPSVLPPTFTLGVTPATQGVCAPADGVYAVNVGSVGGFSNPVALSSTGHPAGTTVGFSTNPVPPPGSSTMTIGNTGVAAPGSYTIDVQGQSSDPITVHQTATLSVFSNPPGTPALLTPANGATNQLLSPNFTWSPATQAATYTLEIATDAAFTNIVHTGSGLTATSYNGATLGPNALYYWRVRTANPCGASSNSTTFSFTTTPVGPFTDPTLTVGQTLIKAVHIAELRSRINAVRATRGLGAYMWTEPLLTAGTTGIKAVHVIELRTALADAYLAAGMTPPTYTGPSPAVGEKVLAIAISELRAAVIALE